MFVNFAVLPGNVVKVDGWLGAGVGTDGDDVENVGVEYTGREYPPVEDDR
jgi:hypothetical protein